MDIAAQKWAVYESNVQQYRILSATVQSFLLAVGSIWFSAQKAPPVVLLIALFLVGIAHIFIVWIPVLKARISIVDYYKGQLDMEPTRCVDLANFCSEDEFRENAEKRRKVVEMFFSDSKLVEPMRRTRKKLDIWVPYGYAIVWVTMGVTKFVQ